MSLSCFLIDDDIDDQELFCDALYEVDKTIQCSLANSGEDALEKIQTDPSLVPDYIFIDVNMPLMNGFVCLKELRKFEQLKNAKMIMYSTSNEEKLAGQSKELGAYGYIVKPPRLSTLIEELSKMINANTASAE